MRIILAAVGVLGIGLRRGGRFRNSNERSFDRGGGRGELSHDKSGGTPL
jgi:hypothetical protein